MPILAALPWKHIGLVVAALLALAALVGGAVHIWNERYRSGWDDGRTALLGEQARAENVRLLAELARRQKAAAKFADTGVRIVRVTDTFTKENTIYAQTPAGAVQCLPADRVRRINDARSLLFAPAPSGGADTVPANAPANGDDGSPSGGGHSSG